MKKLILLLAISAFGCQKDELTARPGGIGTLQFSMGTPTLKANTTSKVPSCKDIDPTEVWYNVTNSRGEDYTYTSTLEKIGNRYVSNPSNPILFGNYRVNNVSLMNGNDTIFALPTVDELQLSPYWDTTLPIDITVAGTETINGTVFCFDQHPAPDLEGLINGGFDPMRVQSLWFAVLDPECIHQVTVEVDRYRYPEIFLWGELLYEVVVPLDYDEMFVRAYLEGEINSIQFVQYNAVNPYNPDGIMTEEDVVVFDYDCP
ncbi:hypothetical protein KCTC52924_00320 [Arenibacter antarcticus]|uniref:Lipoprotein n=1 Tax=Arenibacter antarcticus TaxID=2040469 RepID=A0ABW5VCY4_9FLAO|nr:hypothetical protein [Arenibacter sp. H213]MCM4169541.1 hypothetical protein [Arenibacter sp. H213]